MKIRLIAIGLLWFVGSVVLAATPTLEWHPLAPLPDEHGFGGPFVGVHNGALIVAGGANFPQGPPWGPRPGQKVWHDGIYVLASPNGSWKAVGKLPKRLAYGACLSTADGLLFVGGEEDGEPVADNWRLQWDPRRGTMTVSPMPPLPRPSTYLAAGMLGTNVYVAASHRGASAKRLDEKAFWKFDVANAMAGWTALPVWPGAPRHKVVAVIQKGPHGTPQFYLVSGSNPHFDADGQADLAHFEFYTDGYRFDPMTEKWHAIAELPAVPSPHPTADHERFRDQPRAVAAACGIAVGDSHILVFSGATGRYLTRPVEDRPSFPPDVLAYDTLEDRWSVVSRMPEAVVTTGVTRWNDQLIIASGEIRPGVRTRRVQAAKVHW